MKKGLSKVVGFFSIAAIFCILVASRGAEGKLITIESLLDEMVNYDAIARFPENNFRLKQSSSYNRASKVKEESNMKPIGWFTNHDYNSGENDHNFIRTEEKNGEKEWVIMDHVGPGTIVRTWMPWKSQQGPDAENITIRVYLDGATEPTIEGNMLDLFNGKGIFPYPYAHESLRSAVSFFPIPYAKGCKITTTEMPFFYVINYREYPNNTPIKTFTMEDFNAASSKIEQVGKELLSAEIDIEELKNISVNARIKKDKTKSIQLPKGNKAIRTLSFKLDDYSDSTVMRSVILKMEFDGKPTVWCPIGDFFGCGIGLNPFNGRYRTVKENGEMSCRWVMPYSESGQVSVHNLGDEPINIQLNVEVDNWKWDDSSMYFHASWRGQYPVPTRPFSDWNYISIEGRGVYVGDALTIMNPVKKWWGEGDDKIYVDGDEFPTLYGTGTEDYYGYSWGGRSTDFYEHPFHAQPYCHVYNKLNRKTTNERVTKGYSTETRSRSLDTMPFESSLVLDMEVWSGTDCDMAYGVGMYWYGDYDTKSNRVPDEEGVLIVPSVPE